MMTRGSRHERMEQGPCVFTEPLPCPAIQSPVQRATRVRSRGDQAMVDTVRASCLCGQLSRASPARSFPSSYSERGRVLSCK